MNKSVFQAGSCACVCLGFLLWTFGATADFEESLNPGGTGTVADTGVNAFSHPLSTASREQARLFAVGNSFFKDVWVQAPSSTNGRDGLGPTFNAVSCSACHTLDGRGKGLHETADGSRAGVDFTLLFRLSLNTSEGAIPHPAYGDQLNPAAINDVPGEGRARVEFETIEGTYADGEAYKLRKPKFSFLKLSFGEFENTLVSPRAAMQINGLGLLEAIPQEEILAQEDAEDKNNDGISGRANWVHDKTANEQRVGRFGWKAGQPSLRQQNAAAFLGDLGITTSLFPEQNCPQTQEKCKTSVHGGEPEAEDLILNRLTLYTQLLAVPQRRNFNSPEVKRGEEVFQRVSCQQCHRPSFVTGTHAVEILSSQRIFPYTDLLLHDMGEDLADGRPEALANGREWRTPPLWGVGLIPVVSGHSNLLHDGRARNVEEAILWHGGEAKRSRDAFVRLSKDERTALVEFVRSL